jgi:pyrroloquinoline quinone biosynthesis protein D
VRNDVALTSDSVPVLWRVARREFDPVRQQHVLLYPEGVILLNDTGNVILELVDGQRTIAEIAAILGARYQCDVLNDVTEYLSALEERELIRDR